MDARRQDVLGTMLSPADSPRHRGPLAPPFEFLRIPPFPGRQVSDFKRRPQTSGNRPSPRDCLALLREKRVGGTFWASQPELPSSFLLVRSAAALPFCDELADEHGGILLWQEQIEPAAASNCPTINGECDPWHMLKHAQGLVCDPGDEVRVVAALLGIPTHSVDPAAGRLRANDDGQDWLISHVLGTDSSFSNPFGGHAMNIVELIELCGFWRALIDANRAIDCGLGFAFWKQASVLPLLWGGGDSAGFFRRSAPNIAEGSVAIWRSKAPPAMVEQLERRGTALVEVEDGFLRSKGLGADCVPPLSITVDGLGPYFDPGQPSELENLLEHGRFDPTLIARARQLRETIVSAGLGKYDQDDAVMDRFDEAKRHILVAGQVEDDRSILTGGFELASNLELLKRVRAREPGAYLIYKPHPDVVAGHRKGSIDDATCLKFADKVVVNASISSLVAMVDEVHVNTSLAGFEALMRHKQVTTYGVPFYAGWGLTRDLGPVPARRTSKRSLDELVAATLLIYPRYLDPVSGLPCPAEVVVDRLCREGANSGSFLVAIRRVQGRLRRHLQSFGR